MNWETIATISQACGSLAVVVSLVYMAVQVRQGTRAIRAESARAAVAAMRDFNKAMIQDPVVARIFRLGAEDLSKLSDDERAQFGHLLFSFFKTAEELHYQFCRGALAADIWRTWQTVLAVYATSPGFREYWSRRSILFTPAFRAECESWKDPGLDRSDHFARGVTRSPSEGRAAPAITNVAPAALPEDPA
ncbi:MAG TPA: hypothetical protein VGK93_02410 [Candidatus Eisenbacteria bacterium]|jgi:hypothetical protein